MVFFARLLWPDVPTVKKGKKHKRVFCAPRSILRDIHLNRTRSIHDPDQDRFLSLFHLIVSDTILSPLVNLLHSIVRQFRLFCHCPLIRDSLAILWRFFRHSDASIHHSFSQVQFFPYQTPLSPPQLRRLIQRASGCEPSFSLF